MSWSGGKVLPPLFFFMKLLVILGPLHFHINFRSSFQFSWKKSVKILIGIYQIYRSIWLQLTSVICELIWEQVTIVDWRFFDCCFCSGYDFIWTCTKYYYHRKRKEKLHGKTYLRNALKEKLRKTNPWKPGFRKKHSFVHDSWNRLPIRIQLVKWNY